MDHLLKRPQPCGVINTELCISEVNEDSKEKMEEEEEEEGGEGRERVHREKWLHHDNIMNPAFNSVAKALSVFKEAYSFFEIYIHQLSLLLLTLIVAVLACSLRGKKLSNAYTMKLGISSFKGGKTVKHNFFLR